MKNDVCILKQKKKKTQKCNWSFSRRRPPSGFLVMDQNSKDIVLINNSWTKNLITIFLSSLDNLLSDAYTIFF